MDYKTTFYPESNLTGLTFVDGTLAFYNKVHTLLEGRNKEDAVVLDIGCGRGFYAHEIYNMGDKYRRRIRNFKGAVKKVIGVDVDENAHSNPTIDEFHLINPNQKWPLENEIIDLIVCDFVVEHVEDVDLFFREANRVLKPNGWLCIRTSNKNGYVGLLARVIPNRSHAKVLEKAQEHRKEEDVFPTTYKCNTYKQLNKQLRQFRFQPYVYPYEAEPTYLNINKFLYYLGVVFQRWAPKSLRNTFFAFGQKIG